MRVGGGVPHQLLLLTFENLISTLELNHLLRLPLTPPKKMAAPSLILEETAIPIGWWLLPVDAFAWRGCHDSALLLPLPPMFKGARCLWVQGSCCWVRQHVPEHGISHPPVTSVLPTTQISCQAGQGFCLSSS